jgi:hypothetical protein
LEHELDRNIGDDDWTVSRLYQSNDHSYCIVGGTPARSNNHNHFIIITTATIIQFNIRSDIDALQQPQPQYQPMPIEQVVEYIHKERPAVFFCPHVETSTGILLPDLYIQQIATAMHSVNGLLVLDCIASGCIWIDVTALGVDKLITALVHPVPPSFVCPTEL